MDSTESRCYLCQELESTVGHNTESCPFVKCKNCGKQGHVRKYCPDLVSKTDQNSVKSSLTGFENFPSKSLYEDLKTDLVVKYVQISDFVLSSCVEVDPHKKAIVDVMIPEKVQKGLTCIKNLKLNIPGLCLTSRFPMMIKDATKVLSLTVINTSNETVRNEFFDYFCLIEL